MVFKHWQPVQRLIATPDYTPCSQQRIFKAAAYAASRPVPSTPNPRSSTSSSADKERELNSRFLELERQELERMMKASSPSRNPSEARDVDVSWQVKSDSPPSSSTDASSSRPAATSSTPDRSSLFSRPPTSSAASAASAQARAPVSSTQADRGAGGWWQIGEKLHERLTGRSKEHEPMQPSDGGSSAAHQAEMILQLILEQQRENARLQGTDLVALAGRSLRARLAGREIPSVASTPIDIRRKVMRAAINVCLHCLETGKAVLPTSGWASGLSSIIEDHHPQLFIVSVAYALDLDEQDAAVALEEALISLCKAALADALPGANRGVASSDAGQASIQRLQQLNAALKPFLNGRMIDKFARIYTELFKDTSERDRLWLLLAFKSVADKDAAALVAVAEALGVNY